MARRLEYGLFQETNLKNNYSQSIDEIRIGGLVQEDKYDDFIFYLNDNFGEPKLDNSMNHFFYHFTRELGSSSIRVSLGRNEWKSKKDKEEIIHQGNDYEFKVIFNPNKVGNEKDLLEQILLYIFSASIKTTLTITNIDVAFDFPFKKKVVHFNKTYEKIVNFKGTEYLKGIKIYDKSKESNLDYDLTRVEISSFIGNQRDTDRIANKLINEISKKEVYVTLPNKPLTEEQLKSKDYKKHKEIIDVCRKHPDPYQVLRDIFDDDGHKEMSRSSRSKLKSSVIPYLNIKQIADYIDKDLLKVMISRVTTYIDDLSELSSDEMNINETELNENKIIKIKNIDIDFEENNKFIELEKIIEDTKEENDLVEICNLLRFNVKNEWLKTDEEKEEYHRLFNLNFKKMTDEIHKNVYGKKKNIFEYRE